MEIKKEINGSEILVKPVGRLDSATSDDLYDFIKDNFDKDMTKLILDFAGIDFISSKGLRIVVSVYKELNGRSLQLINANQSVHEVFRLSGLDKLFNI